MPVELLLLLLTWAATLSLIVILPWAVIRLTVGVLEADVSKPGADHRHERVQPRHTSDAEDVDVLSGTPDDAVEPAEPALATATPDEDADR